jgi:hypothetical protein
MGLCAESQVLVWWERRKYLLTVRFTICLWLVVPTFKLRCRIRSALPAEMETCTPGQIREEQIV